MEIKSPNRNTSVSIVPFGYVLEDNMGYKDTSRFRLEI